MALRYTKEMRLLREVYIICVFQAVSFLFHGSHLSLYLLFLSPSFLLLSFSPPLPTSPLMHPLLTSWSSTVLSTALVKYKKTSFPQLWQPPTNKWMVCCVVKISYNILVSSCRIPVELSGVVCQSNMFSWGNNYA